MMTRFTSPRLPCQAMVYAKRDTCVPDNRCPRRSFTRIDDQETKNLQLLLSLRGRGLLLSFVTPDGADAWKFQSLEAVMATLEFNLMSRAHQNSALCIINLPRMKSIRGLKTFSKLNTCNMPVVAAYLTCFTRGSWCG